MSSKKPSAKPKMDDKKIVLTLMEIYNLRVSLNHLIKLKIPIQISYRLGKIVKVINEELTVIEETRDKLIEKYGETNDKTGNSSIKPDTPQAKEFQKEFNSFLKGETITFEFEKLNLSDLQEDAPCPKCGHVYKKSINIETQYMVQLEVFFKDE